jgi:hypothetical protein
MSFIIPLFILAVIITLFSFISHIKFEKIPKSVPAGGECDFEVEVKSVPAEVEPVSVPQSQIEDIPLSEISYPTLDAVVEKEIQSDETQAPKKKHYYYKPKSKK